MHICSTLGDLLCVQEKFAAHPEMQSISEWLHFACTSEDISNLSYALMLQEARARIVLPAMNEVVERVTALAHKFADVPMLGRTHGQAATPTTVGKEMANFAYRLGRQRAQYANVAVMGKAWYISLILMHWKSAAMFVPS